MQTADWTSISAAKFTRTPQPTSLGTGVDAPLDDLWAIMHVYWSSIVRSVYSWFKWQDSSWQLTRVCGMSIYAWYDMNINLTVHGIIRNSATRDIYIWKTSKKNYMVNVSSILGRKYFNCEINIFTNTSSKEKATQCDTWLHLRQIKCN